MEYFGSLIIENDSMGGYTNNMQDLIANMVGAGIGAALAYRFRAYTPEPDQPARLTVAPKPR